MEVKSGILLTGGTGSRLSSFTSKVANKHMYPIYDKLVIDYSINTVLSLGIKNLTVILGGNYFPQIVDLLKDGKDLGLKINYVFQSRPAGIAEAINLFEPFLKDERFAVILGDNIFQKPIQYNKESDKAEIFLNNSEHIDLHQFGVASIFNNIIMGFEEKPKIIATGMDNYAVVGCYIFTQKFFEYFKNIKPSSRNEWEVIEIIKQYYKNNELDYSIQKGWWSDSGTLESINKVRELVKSEPVEFVK